MNRTCNPLVQALIVDPIGWLSELMRQRDHIKFAINLLINHVKIRCKARDKYCNNDVRN